MDLHLTEVPATPTNKPQAAETISQGKNDGGESASTTLVDLSESNEPKQDEAGGDVELQPAPGVPTTPDLTHAEAGGDVELEPAPGVPTTPDLTHAEKVEAIAKDSEDKREVIVQNTQTKEGHPRKTTGADAAKSDATPTPTSEHKTIAPIDVAI